MNKAYLLMLCLISASFTGCLEDDNYDTVTDTTDDSTSDDITGNTENTSETDNENTTSVVKVRIGLS